MVSLLGLADAGTWIIYLVIGAVYLIFAYLGYLVFGWIGVIGAIIVSYLISTWER